MYRGAFILILLALVGGIASLGLAATLTVPDDYPTIQAAVDAAQPGDTVYVKAGRYVENITIIKPLQLKGEDRTKVIIQSPDEENNVISIDLSHGNVEVEGIEVTGGNAGIYLYVAGDVQVTLSNIISYRDQFGIYAMGSSNFSLTKSYLIGNKVVGLMLMVGHAHVQNNEVVTLGGAAGIVLGAWANVTLENNLVGLCNEGIITNTTSCGLSSRKFTGKVTGKGDRVYGLETDLCPAYPGSPWPNGFIDNTWEDAIGKAVDSFSHGVTLDNDQDYKGALAAYTAGLRLLANAPFPLLETYFDQVIGVIYTKLGRYEEALKAYNLARVVFAAHGMDVDVATTDQDIGAVYLKLDRYNAALNEFKSARAVFAAYNMDANVANIDTNIGAVYWNFGCYTDALSKYQSARAVYVAHNMDVEVANIDQNIGAVYWNLGCYTDALSKYQSARAVYVAHNMDVEVANIDQNIGAVYWNLGCYTDALSKYQSARAVYVAHNMNVEVANIDQNIGIVYTKLAQYNDALTSYQEALNILDKTPPVAGMAYSYPATRWVIYNNMGIANEGLKNWDAARQSYEKSIAVIESLRGYMRSEKIKTAWQERTQDVYERLIKLLIDHGHGADAFPYAEHCRARTFLDLLAKGPVGTITNIKEAGIKSGVVNPTAISKDVQDVIKSLPADTAALEYFVTDTATYVWVIRNEVVNGPITIPHSRQELMNKIIEARKWLEEGKEVVNRDLAELYDWLIRPVEDFLPKTTGEGKVPHLIIIPSGPLYYLPFQALIWTSEDHSKNAPLITRYALSYSPSVATLKYAQQREGTAYPQSTFLGLADPVPWDPTIRRLPEAQTEARTVAKLFPVAAVYVDKQATEDVVQSHSAIAREVLLSTHGSFNPHNPMFSYLLTTPTVKNKDGKLHAYEVFRLPLHADMVVLSACETLLPSLEQMTDQLNKIARRAGDNTPQKLTEDQLKELTAGDEVVGLTRAFLSAGAGRYFPACGVCHQIPRRS